MHSPLYLPVHRQPRSLADHLLRGLMQAFVAGIAAEVAILASSSGARHVDHESGTAAWARSAEAPQVVARMMMQYDCSTTGYPEGVSPRSSIVETVAGRYRLVSFDRGWAVHTGDAPGTLVAVCLGRAR